MAVTGQKSAFFSRMRAWQREITDALTLYSISTIACAGTFYSPLFEKYLSFARAQEGLLGARVTIVLLFMGIASSVFGVRRLVDQRVERVRRLEAERRAESVSLRDPLTQLPNRRCLENELTAAIERGSPDLTVLLIGLKGFADVTNLHGHAGADAVLSQVATRLRQKLGGAGLLARVADDEFAVALSAEKVDRAASMALRLAEDVRHPVQIGIYEHVIDANVGIAQLASDRRTSGELLRRARVALDRARSLDTHCCFFDSEMDARLSARALLERDFRAALGTDAIQLHFQPIIDLRSGRVVSCEALARWIHPEQGVVMPGTFLPLADDLGLMETLSGQLFADACRQAVAWPEPISLSFNFPPSLLGDPSLGDAVLGVLKATGLAPHRLEAEITEEALVNDVAIARAVLQTLERAGVRIAMDDFGTGYSSLRHLRELRFDKIKIDRSFVQEVGSDADCAAIVAAVAGLGRGLNIDTVAEGIETAEQLALVRAAGCTHGQGFLIARPRPVGALDFMPFAVAEQRWATA